MSLEFLVSNSSFLFMYSQYSSFSMSTEIIKLNSFKNNLQSIFATLVSKFRSPQSYDITLVIQESAEGEKLPIRDIDKLSMTELGESQKSKRSVNFNDNALILNQDSEEHCISMSDCISQPNFQSEQRIPQRAGKGSIRVKRNMSKNKENRLQTGHLTANLTANNYAQTEPVIQSTDSKAIITEIRLEDSINSHPEKDYSFKLNNIELDSEQTEEASDSEDNDSNAGFLIEKHLNQALSLVEQNKIDDLEDFLYHYKEKYSFINVRTQTKWSLLMAHCKESKLEYERAATNYSQVIEQLKEYPRIMVVDLGVIYSKLGRCFYESGMWNKAIGSYTLALNHFKQSKKIQEYASTMVSLGILYLEVNYFVEAEKCFLVAYDIRRHEGDTNNRTNILPLLLNLVDSNISLKNYTQAQQILQLMHQIISESDPVDHLLVIGYHAKQAKLHFLVGELDKTFKQCQLALGLLAQKKCQSQEYGEVLEIMGLLKQERGEYLKSKDYFQRALKAIQKCLSIDNVKIQILKKRISTLSKFTNQKSNRLLIRQASLAHESDDQEQVHSDCFDPELYPFDG